MKHEDVWYAIDTLAANYGVSTSMLAKLAGLDPTTFNKSKRIGKDGKKRWPSTESLAKVMEVTGCGMNDIVPLIEDNSDAGDYVPLLDIHQIKKTELFDNKGNLNESGTSLDGLDMSSFYGNGNFALEINGNELSPFYYDGDVLIISSQASIRKGDKIIIKKADKIIIAGIFIKQTAQAIFISQDIDLERKNDNEIRLEKSEIEWFSRVMWVSQ
jgi:phage repressor protein C with HTH and peptisase S24 domain